MNTLIRYQYRDAANYKENGCLVLRGMCSQNQAQALRDQCLQENGEYFFVPSLVGMKDLQPKKWNPDLDHPYHYITSIEMTGSPAEDSRSVADLITEFSEQDWNEVTVR